MSARTDCPHFEETWMDRHIAEFYLLTLTSLSVLSFWLLDNFIYGFLLGLVVATWVLLRCMAKKVFYATTHRFRGTEHEK